ncbi:unnamed protein product [Auanema sp. JU1783]|nr:unnamed protein product [Auanema sp. JU1783]
MISHEDNDNIAMEEMVADAFPDWSLIDEVSMPLLEQGIARFDTLQALLPSLMTIDTSKMGSEEIEKLPKLLRIAQMQIEHTLKTQYKLMTEIDELNSKLSSYKRQVRALRTKVEQKENEVFFQCFTCGKCFITQEFLATHIQERHQ